MVLGGPTAIGRYAIRESLGTGGFATVYRAYDPVLDREVALKVLHPHLAQEEDTRERFIREGRTLARIHHPNIVQVFDAGVAEGSVYLAMQLIEGRSLATIVRDGGPLSVGRVARITEQVGAALSALHERGLIHCDIKPANILLDREHGRAVLLDLGVARRLDETASTRGWLWGTPAYMAPEQIAPDGTVSPRTDVYQLGATAHALLAGEPPFTGQPTQVMYAVMHQAPPDLALLRPGVPPRIAAEIGQALSKDPDVRPHSAAAFAGALAMAVDSDSGTVESEAITQRIFAGALPPADSSLGAQPTLALAGGAPAEMHPGRSQRASSAGRDRSSAPGERPSRPRSRVPMVVGGAVAALLLAGAAGLAWMMDGGSDGGSVTGSQTPIAGVVAEATRTPAAAAAPTQTQPSPSPSPVPTPSPEPTPAATATSRPTATPQPTSTPQPTPTPARPTPSPPAATATPPPVAGAVEGIAGLLEQVMQQRRYVPSGPVEPVPINSDAVLYVQRGDGPDGQRLFIFLNDRFLGTDWQDASPAVSNPRSIGPGQFAVSYADGDGGSVPVIFQWNGGGISPNRTAPGHCLPTTGC